MDPAIARELAQAYMRTRPRAGWPEEVTRAAVDLLPDTDAWAVLEDEQGWAVRVVDAGAIYRLSVLDAGQRRTVTVHRQPLADYLVSATVGESIVADIDRTRLRQRQWRFDFRDGEILMFDTQERLADERLAGEADTERLELFARELAGAGGWGAVMPAAGGET